MSNHKSAIKRVRQTESRRQHNHYYAKTTRTAIKTLRKAVSKSEAEALLPKTSSMVDKLVKRRVIHKNKAANIKSQLAKYVNTLA